VNCPVIPHVVNREKHRISFTSGSSLYDVRSSTGTSAVCQSVTVKHVGWPDVFCNLNRRPAELCVPLRVVGIISGCSRHINRRGRNTPHLPRRNSARHSIPCRQQFAEKRSRVPPIGIVKLGITTAVACSPAITRYSPRLVPCATSAFGSASTTSARPPVFENGSPSDATKRILTLCSPRAPWAFYANRTPPCPSSRQMRP